MPTSSIQVTEGAGKRLASHQISEDSQTKDIQRITTESGRQRIADFGVVSFRTAGLTTQPHNLFTIWNPAASGRRLAIKRLVMEADHTTLLATNLQVAVTIPTAQPSAGTTLASKNFDFNSATAAVAICLGATASDGGAATAITATAGTPRIWSNFVSRAHTLAGWFLINAQNLLPADENGETSPILIPEGSGLLVQTVSVATAGAHYVVKAWWEEYTP